MNKLSGKRVPPEPDDIRAANERRRIGQIVHDDRGSASVEWRNAPTDYERPVLELENGSGGSRGDAKLRRGFDPALSIKDDDSFNPYDRKPEPFGGAAAATKKRDLRKLSQWVKMMRELEERKKNGDSD